MLEFALAERLGRTVAELRSSMTHAEFVEWAAFFKYRASMAEHEANRRG